MCAQSEKNSTMATTGSDTNTVNQMRPEFFILLNSISAHKEKTVVACVAGVANFVVCAEGTKTVMRNLMSFELQNFIVANVKIVQNMGCVCLEQTFQRILRISF
jgi:hypothetical protein